MNALILPVLFALLPAAAAAQGAPQRIGVAGGVNGLVQATAPGAAARAIKSGAPLFLNDRVVTDAKGKLQLMLLDETVFTVGPNSDLTLDEFVYDPANDGGKVSAKIAKGAFRFVTGKVARKDPASMDVKLSVGTIGIRGTIVGGRADENGATVILLGPGSQNNANEAPGAITVGNGSASVYIDQPGYGVTLAQGQQSLQVADMSQQAAQLSSELSQEPAPEGGQTSGEGSGRQAEGGGQASEGGSAAGSGQQGGGDTAGSQGTSISEAAGQTTAAALNTLSGIEGLGSITQQLSDTTNSALEQIISNSNAGDTTATWDEMRSVEAGVLRYSGSGSAELVDTLGGNTGVYDLNFDLEVDFGDRTLGGGVSKIALKPAGGPEEYDSADILETPFSSLSGDAALTLQYAEAGGSIDNQNFDNSVLTFLNSDGGTANKVRLDAVYDDKMYVTGSGSATSGAPVATISSWDQVRTIEAGQLRYSGTGSLIGGSATGPYTVNLTLDVDFGNRIFGGGASAISMYGGNNPGYLSPSTDIQATDFNALTGTAVAVLTAAGRNLGNAAFDGTVLAFNGGTGSPADHITAAVAYNDAQMGVTGGGAAVTGQGQPVPPAAPPR